MPDLIDILVEVFSGFFQRQNLANVTEGRKSSCKAPGRLQHPAEWSAVGPYGVWGLSDGEAGSCQGL